jgi:hypothetical protein
MARKNRRSATQQHIINAVASGIRNEYELLHCHQVNHDGSVPEGLKKNHDSVQKTIRRWEKIFEQLISGELVIVTTKEKP